MEKTCLNCGYAKWKITNAGRLSSSGDGNCRWQMPKIDIPKAFYYLLRNDIQTAPAPIGGYINRNEEHSDCPTWKAKGE